MALSKWFLYGAEEAFDKDENLAFTFAKPEFVMGYHKEVGVGGSKYIDTARVRYQLVSRARTTRRDADHNPDARLPIMGTRMPSSVWRPCLGCPPIALEAGARHDHGIETVVSARRRNSARSARAVGRRGRRSRTADRWLTLSGRP